MTFLVGKVQNTEFYQILNRGPGGVQKNFLSSNEFMVKFWPVLTLKVFSSRKIEKVDLFVTKWKNL